MYHTQKHLTLEDRNYIEQALNQNVTFSEMGKYLQKGIHATRSAFVELVVQENAEHAKIVTKYVLNLMKAYVKD